MTWNDLEQHLASLAVQPRIDTDHREALAARLQHRFRVRRRRRQATLALATFLVFSGALVRQPSLVSYGFRYADAVLLDDNTLVMTRFAGDNNVFSSTMDEVPSQEAIARKMERAGTIDAIHRAGQDRLVRLLGIENASGRFVTGSYLAIVDGETTTTGYALESDISAEFSALVRSGRFHSIIEAANANLLPQLPDSTAVVDGTPFRFQRWLAHAPELGDFVLLKGIPAEDALAAAADSTRR